MHKKSKSVLLATLLAGMSTFVGCDQKSEKATKEDSSLNEAKIQRFEKIAKSIPIFRDELPHAMILDDGKGGYVQMLYPVKRASSVLEDKDQYEKRVKWLNEKCPVDIPQPSLTLRGCKWVDYSNEPRLPFVSIFDKKEYIYQHIAWMKGFYRPGNKFGVNYVPEKDPVVLWWVAQTEFHGLFSEKKKAKAPIRKSQKENY